MQGHGKSKEPGKPGKPVLRIIPGGAATPGAAPATATPTAPKPPRPQSNLGKLLSAYADAIDRDVKLLLDL